MFWILIVLLFGLVNASNNSDRGCESETLCMKCGPRGCIKCPELIVHPSRRCVSRCPYGHNASWSTRSDYMGRICVHNGNLLGLSPEAATIVTGVITGTVLCTIMISSIVIYLRIKNRKQPQNLESSSDLDDSPEQRDFIKQLESLRPYAQIYLDMLNDARRHVRDFYRSGDVEGVAAYKPILRDLAKILLLLNCKVDSIIIPEGWEHLLEWGEKALKRYRSVHDISDSQVVQLVNFLQGSAEEKESKSSTTMSTFKPDQMFGSSLSLQRAKNLSNSYELELKPEWKFEYSLVNPMSSSEFNPKVWQNSKEYFSSSLFFDDDFCQLGFRPQDEITTEL